MSSQIPRTPGGVVWVMRIINGFLLMSVAMFSGIAILMTQNHPPKDPRITYLGMGVLVLGVLASAMFRLPMSEHRVRQITKNPSFDPHSDEVFLALAPTYQTERIIRLALLEGAAFFNGVAYLLEKVWWNLAAMGLAMGLMLIGFPSRSQINAWIERRTLGQQFGDSELS